MESISTNSIPIATSSGEAAGTTVGDEVTGEALYFGKPADKLIDEEILSLSFVKEEDAYDFYHRLGYLCGFGVRRNDLKKNKAGEVMFQSYKCSFAGHREKKHFLKEVMGRRTQNLTRCGCEARLHIGLDRTTMRLGVRKFTREHNHNLISPSLVHVHRNHRQMKEADILQANALKECGVSNRNVMSILARQRGGYAKLGFTKKDFNNQQHAERRQMYHGRDAELAISYLCAKGGMNSAACYRYTTDAEGRLENLFWANAKSVVDYRVFNDVMSFDSTYDTNYYSKPLVLFVGCNNHRQTILFGSAFLVNERQESYIWLLIAFLECHDGMHPSTVITDGDNSMRIAITTCFPKSARRLCHWHLSKNCRDNINDDVFFSKYQNLRDMDCTEEEFDAQWTKILEEHGVPGTCRWAVENYEKRQFWSNCFLSGQFCGGMKSTQRSEGINAFIKSFIRPEMKIFEVLELFDRELEGWRQKEHKEEYISLYTTPVIRTSLESLERHAAEIYTPVNYRKFVKTLVRDQTYVVSRITRSDCRTYATYDVQKYASSAKYRIVEYYKDDTIFKCSCKHFEGNGMICVHMIVVFKIENIQRIPDSCILKRWTKLAGSELASTNSQHTSTLKERNLRYAALSSICNHLCNAAADDTALFSCTRDKLLLLCSETEYSRANGIGGNRGRDNSTLPQGTHGILDPKIVRSKGCRGQRGQDGRKPKANPRLCSVCREPGHKVTTCPTRRTESYHGSQSQPQSSSQIDQTVQPTIYNMHAPYYYPFMQPPMPQPYFQPHGGQSSVQVPFTSSPYSTAHIYGSETVRDALKFSNQLRVTHKL